MHRTQDTYSLSHFRQRTSEHLDRIREGRVETITQNGQAAMVVMSPATTSSSIRPSVDTNGAKRSGPTGLESQGFPREKRSATSPRSWAWSCEAI